MSLDVFIRILKSIGIVILTTILIAVFAYLCMTFETATTIFVASFIFGLAVFLVYTLLYAWEEDKK